MTSAVLNKAEEIALRAHYGQIEESTGDPYICHIERVVDLVDGDDAKAVAWLHAEYIQDIKESDSYLAIAVKLADLRDHLRPNCPERLRAALREGLGDSDE